LAKVIDTVAYQPRADGTFDVVVLKDGKNVQDFPQITADQLAENIGKTRPLTFVAGKGYARCKGYNKIHQRKGYYSWRRRYA